MLRGSTWAGAAARPAYLAPRAERFGALFAVEQRLLEQHFLTHPGKLAVLVAAAGILPGERVLELGSGAGTVAAALPPCKLTLVELDPELAAALRARFPGATVWQGDALEALEDCPAEVILSNLPHALTVPMLIRLARKPFRCAVVAVREDDALTELQAVAGAALELTPLVTLNEDDFTPPQPFKSKLMLVTR